MIKILLIKKTPFFSRKMAKYIGSDHHEFRLKKVLNDDVDKALLSFDQPFAGTITSYYLSKKISRHVKSVLTGDGADELFGLYISKKGRGLHKIKQYKFAIRIYPKKSRDPQIFR